MAVAVVDGSPNVLLAENMIEAENARDYDRLFSVVAPAVVLHPGAQEGLPELRATLSAFYDAFPDHHRTVLRWIPAGDTVVVHWRLTGTHLGAWHGLSPTGRSIDVEGCTIWEFADLRVSAMSCFCDRAFVLDELGIDVRLWPTPAGTAPLP